MGCRVGITTDPDRRKREWQQEYPNLWDWKLLAEYATKSAAQARENEEAARRSCDSGYGGPGDEYDTWHVYYFRF